MTHHTDAGRAKNRRLESVEPWSSQRAYTLGVSRKILALFAKAAVPGQVKTRLVPPLSLQQAAELYEAMLRDILDLHAGRVDSVRALWFAPAAAWDWFVQRAPSRYELYPQLGATLAARMAQLFRTHAAQGYDRIVLRGTDSPSLPAARIDQAFDALESADLVLCPDRDGGYNLIGMHGPCEALFEFEMSTESVLAATLQRARESGLVPMLLPSHHDVDTFEDLELLEAESARDLAPRTFVWLEAWMEQLRASMAQ